MSILSIPNHDSYATNIPEHFTQLCIMSSILATNYLHFQNALVHDTVVDCFHGLLYENLNIGVYEIRVHRIEIRADTLFEFEIWGAVNTGGKGHVTSY